MKKNFDFSKLQIYFFVTIFSLVILLVVFLLKPYLASIFLAGVFAIVFYPLQRKLLTFLKKYLPWRDGILAKLTSPFVVVVIFLLILLLPLSFIGSQIVFEVKELYGRLTGEGNPLFLQQLIGLAEGAVEGLFPAFSFDFSQYAQQALQWTGKNLSGFFQGLGSFLLAIFVFLISFYYFLKDGDRLLRFFYKASPLPDQIDKQIMDKMSLAVYSIMRGYLAVAIIQGILTGIGFAVFGIPSPTLWGALAAMFALVPTVGTSLVLLGGILYLFFNSSLYLALGLLLWGIIAVGLIDNILGPYLMKQGIRIHPFLILLGVLGGVGLFGPTGFLIGPLIISLMYALFDVYFEIAESGNQT